MPFQPDNITREHIEAAVQKIKDEKIELNNSTGYDVIINDEAYPPKEIMRYAHELMNGEKRWERSGGEPTNRYFERLGYEVMGKTDKAESVQQSIIESYKALISEDGNQKELYKWQLIKKFQEQWDIDAPDFAKMLQSMDFGNLLDHRSKTFIKFAHEYPEEARQAFKMLYDEESELQERIKAFGEQAEALVKTEHPDLGAFQDERSMATYLTFRYPDAYTIYKYSFYSTFAKHLGEQIPPTGQKYIHYLALVRDFISEYVSQDEELVSLSRSTLDDGCFVDKNLNILAQDILFRVLDNDDDSDQAFKQVLEAVGYEDASSYFNLLSILVNELNIQEKDQRVHYAVRKQYNRFAFTIGDRYCLTLSTRDNKRFGFIYPEEESPVGKFGSFKGAPMAYFHTTDLFADVDREYQKIKLSCLSELNRSQKSRFRMFTNSIFERAVFDSEFRKQIFMETFDKQPQEKSQVAADKAPVKSRPLNQILYGPPGTGKTYNTVNRALQIVDPDLYEQHKNDRKALTKRYGELLITDWDDVEGKKIAFVTFHQSFTYEDFVEGIKPVENDGKLTYTIEDGVFKRVCKEAANGNRVLIIDEINRGNIAQIFGELITLIEPDKRQGGDEELRVILPYSKKEFSVPANLHIIGTMNTADRSVEALDTALRRRFSFEELPPKPKIIRKEGASSRRGGMVSVYDSEIQLDELLEVINNRVEKLLDKDHLIGHSYFMKVSSMAGLRRVFHRNIIPLLEEYFYGDKGKIQLVLGRGFVVKQEQGFITRFADSDYDDSVFDDREVWRITTSWRESEQQFEEALLRLLNRQG